MQILVTIGSGVSEGAGVEFPTFPLTCVVVLKTLRHYRASVWLVFFVLLMLFWMGWLYLLLIVIKYIYCVVILLRVTTYTNEDLRMESESSATWYLLPFVFFQCEIKPLICARVVITVINSAVLLKCKNYGLLCCLSPLWWLDTEMFAEVCQTVNGLILKLLW